jgi:hypothetical protein
VYTCFIAKIVVDIVLEMLCAVSISGTRVLIRSIINRYKPFLFFLYKEIFFIDFTNNTSLITYFIY